MSGLVGTEQDRSYGDAAAGGHPQQVEGDVGRVQTGHDQEIGFLRQMRVGEDPIEQHKLDLALEVDAYRRLNDAIALCVSNGDNGTRELLERILLEEEESIDWHEAQLHLIDEVGRQNYLSQQIRD